MSFHQRDEIRWNKKGYYERFDGKKYWRKLCVIEGCMKRAKVLNWCKRHYTEEKQKSSISNETTRCHQLQGVSQIPMPPPSYLYTSNSSTCPVRNEIRINKRGFREQFDGIGHWRPLCIWNQCSKRAKKLSYCKRHYTERLSENSISTTSTNIEVKNDSININVNESF